MKEFLLLQYALCFMRVGIGLLTMLHGIPKMSGIETWHNLGTTFMFPLGITFLPTMWGFLGGCTEFFGGIALMLGLGTRAASFSLVIMMFIAAIWHIKRGDSFNVYSFPISLCIVYLTFMVIGGGDFSLDYYIFGN